MKAPHQATVGRLCLQATYAAAGNAFLTALKRPSIARNISNRTYSRPPHSTLLNPDGGVRIMAQPSILVLEDDEIIRSLMVDVLEDFGAHVTSFPSADEGMIYLERGDDPVDLIVSDIQMPGLLNGYDLSKVVAHRWPSVPVVLTSGNIKLAAQLGGSVRFLPKPWSAEHLVECVQTALSQQGMSLH